MHFVGSCVYEREREYFYYKEQHYRFCADDETTEYYITPFKVILRDSPCLLFPNAFYVKHFYNNKNPELILRFYLSERVIQKVLTYKINKYINFELKIQFQI